MALEHHIEALKKKHAHIDQMLHAEEARAGSDDLVVHKLKLQKLGVKDEIQRLLLDQAVAA